MPRKLLAFALLANAVLLGVRCWQESPWAVAGGEPVVVENGDTNGDGQRDIGDAVFLLSWLFQGGPEPVAIAEQGGGLTPEQEAILSTMSLGSSPGLMGRTLRIEGVNVQIVNGTGATAGEPNGRGNLVIGYAELDEDDERRGSHNLVIGSGHSFTSFGGLLAGMDNEVTGRNSSVIGGRRNRATGRFSAVTGGGGPGDEVGNLASGDYSAVSGGNGNWATGEWSSVSGGSSNQASGSQASISGGVSNQATSLLSSVSGGTSNTASGAWSSVSGGRHNEASGDDSSVSGGGGLFEEDGNEAAGRFSSISGGTALTVEDEAGHAP